MMKKYSGQLRKMSVHLEVPVRYSLEFDGSEVVLNEWIGKQIQFTYVNKINCINCGKTTKKSFNQGYCFPCMRKLAVCDTCIIKPELCHYHQGTCREPSWGESHCFVSHKIYLSNTSGIKVGITRESQVPTRWIDQGAIQALCIATVRTRLQSGLVEQALKALFNDKTNWRAMLKGIVERLELTDYRQQALDYLQGGVLSNLYSDNFNDADIALLTDESITEIDYPVDTYLEKISSINLEKTPEWCATLLGIKGQYLITDIGVINIRKYTGYEVEITVI